MKLNIRIINFCNFMSYLIVKISDKNIAFYVGIIRLHFKRCNKKRHVIKTINNYNINNNNYNNKQLSRFLNTRFFIVNILLKNISILTGSYIHDIAIRDLFVTYFRVFPL